MSAFPCRGTLSSAVVRRRASKTAVGPQPPAIPSCLPGTREALVCRLVLTFGRLTLIALVLWNLVTCSSLADMKVLPLPGEETGEEAFLSLVLLHTRVTGEQRRRSLPRGVGCWRSLGQACVGSGKTFGAVLGIVVGRTRTAPWEKRRFSGTVFHREVTLAAPLSPAGAGHFRRSDGSACVGGVTIMSESFCDDLGPHTGDGAAWVLGLPAVNSGGRSQ